MSVEYRDINGFSGYRVGDDGSVWTCKTRRSGTWEIGTEWKLIRPTKNVSNHLRVKLYDGEGHSKSFSVHTLVLTAFRGACPSGMEACHWDDDQTNNNLYNLRWDTRLNNWVDRRRNGRTSGAKGEKNAHSTLTDDAVRSIREKRRAGALLRVLAEEFRVSESRISSIAKQKGWRHVA